MQPHLVLFKDMVRCRHDPKMQDIELDTEKVAVKEAVSVETMEMDDKRAKGR